MTNHTPDATPHQMSGSQQHTLNHAPSTGEGHKIEERSGATPPGSTGMPNLDSSNSTQELLQQAFTPISQPPIRDHFMVSEATPVPIPMYYGNATPTGRTAPPSVSPHCIWTTLQALSSSPSLPFLQWRGIHSPCTCQHNHTLVLHTLLLPTQ